MWRWTLQSLLSEPMALAASIAATAAALLLVMFFEAVYAGESEQIVAYVEHSEADVWVMQRGVSNMHMATSYLSDWKASQVRAVPGVAEVDAILYLNTVIESGDRPWFSYIIGLDVPSSLAGPWAMAAGRAEPGPGEAVVPVTFARMTDLALGDPVRITDRNFTVVGFSDGTFSMANSVVFVARNDLEHLMRSLDIVSFLLVRAEAGVDAPALAADIEREIDDVRALTADEFVRNDRRMAMQMGVDMIALMTLIGGALAMLLVAFTIYSQVARQRRELAVVKALGASNRALYISVGLQAAAVTAASVAMAAGLALVLMPIATALVAPVTLKLTAAAVARIAVAGIGVTLLASLISVHQIARVDPLSAFSA
jgi:putative ABC transport system permease protein